MHFIDTVQLEVFESVICRSPTYFFECFYDSWDVSYSWWASGITGNFNKVYRNVPSRSFIDHISESSPFSSVVERSTCITQLCWGHSFNPGRGQCFWGRCDRSCPWQNFVRSPACVPLDTPKNSARIEVTTSYEVCSKGRSQDIAYHETYTMSTLAV